jgi:hypothetical protein
VTLPLSQSSSDEAMANRFVHTADVHLDAPQATLPSPDPGMADLIDEVTRKALAPSLE